MFGLEPAEPVPLLRPDECYTDECFCGGDSFNAGAGFVALTRANTGTASHEPLVLDADATRRRFQTAGLALKSLCKHSRKKSVLGAPPQLAGVMKEPCGVLLFEFFWQDRRGEARDWHVITVNCDSRWVFCNTLGYIPFNHEAAHESGATHAAVVELFKIRRASSLFSLRRG